MVLFGKLFYIGFFRYMLDDKNWFMILLVWCFVYGESDMFFVMLYFDGYIVVLLFVEVEKFYEKVL